MSELPSIPWIYRHTPTEVSAIQWRGDNVEQIWEYISDEDFIPPSEDGDQALLYNAANDTWIPIEVGEWILEDELGYYPNKEEQFQKNYEAV